MVNEAAFWRGGKSLNVFMNSPTTTEAAIMQTIEALMHGRTTLIITHRIATVHDVEKIVVLAKGGVVEEGSGPELVARNKDGNYYYTQLFASPMPDGK